MYRLSVPFKNPVLYLIVFCGLFSFLCAGCRSDDSSRGGSDESGGKYKVLSDVAIADYRRTLLLTGYEFASSIPLSPHIKDRSRAQEKVVLSCLELNQPITAKGFIKGISNWRKGNCLGELAIYCAKHGFEKEARDCIALAEKAASVKGLKEWRSGRIKVKAARAEILLGDDSEGNDFGDGSGMSEEGKLSGAEALVADDEDFDEQVVYLERLRGTGGFEATVNSLRAYVKLYERFYVDIEKRKLIESNINAGWGKLPGFIRVDILLGLSDVCVEHGDAVNGLVFVKEADEFVNGGRWPLENLIKVKADIARGYYICGEVSKARDLLDGALAMFNEGRGRIIDIYRAEALCPVGEVYAAIGDRDSALLVYYQAVEESVENPNSRCRAEDLSLICCSMALSAVEPDTALWGRIKEIQGSLGEPW